LISDYFNLLPLVFEYESCGYINFHCKQIESSRWLTILNYMMLCLGVDIEVHEIKWVQYLLHLQILLVLLDSSFGTTSSSLWIHYS
jgi:hypothetical protein